MQAKAGWVDGRTDGRREGERDGGREGRREGGREGGDGACTIRGNFFRPNNHNNTRNQNLRRLIRTTTFH